MKFPTNTLIFKRIAVLISLIIVSLILWNTYIFFQKFKTEEKLSHEYSLEALLKRPNIDYKLLSKIENAKPFLEDRMIIEQVENQIKYEGYIKRQLDEIEKYRKNENTKQCTMAILNY